MNNKILKSLVNRPYSINEDTKVITNVTPNGFHYCKKATLSSLEEVTHDNKALFFG